MNTDGALRAYRWRLLLLALPLVAYTFWIALRDKSWRYCCQRLGFNYPELHSPLWIHCASLGEVNAALPLIEGLKARWPAIVVTTNTTTGADRVAAFGDQPPTHAYLPLDFTYAARRFIAATRPCAMLVMETELWPNIYACAASNELNPIIVNARLSERTVNAERWLTHAYQGCLFVTQKILARSAHDAQRFIQLGANAEQVDTIGNIKFSTPLRTHAGNDIVGRPYVLVASTHADEEQKIAARWLNTDTQDRLLVIAPRHPQRGATVFNQLIKLTPRIARRSVGDTPGSTTKIYLADTLGELDTLFAYAEIVIMGGTFAEVGGHNVLEPARHGATIVCGPSMHNFSAELQAMLDHNAIIQLENIDSLVPVVGSLLNGTREKTGPNARQWIDQQSNILDCYLQRICQLLPQLQDGSTKAS